MIQQFSKFEWNGLKAEVNYSKEVKPCKKIKFTIGKESAEIDRHDLYALLQLYADDKEMEATLTQKTMKPITKLMQVTTEKNLKKGEALVFPMTQWVTVEVAEEWERLNKEKMITQEEAKKKLTK